MLTSLTLQTLHPLKDYTSLKVGGLARYFCTVETLDQYLDVLHLSKEKNLPIFILGKGSNTLFIDEVFEAIVVLNKIQKLDWQLPCVVCGSALNISLLSSKASRKGLSGLEGASGIPATVGGAVYMNAGSGAWDTAQSLLWVKSIDSEGKIVLREKKDLNFSYRHSLFQEKNEFIVEAAFELKASSTAWDLQQAIIKKRLATQPYKNASAGCFFKNPQGHSAGALIDQAGLKGFELEGAAVSTMHANFLINLQDATAASLLKLEKIIKEKVFEASGIELAREVRLIGNHLYEKI